jgi:hypothetical protein
MILLSKSLPAADIGLTIGQKILTIHRDTVSIARMKLDTTGRVGSSGADALDEPVGLRHLHVVPGHYLGYSFQTIRFLARLLTAPNNWTGGAESVMNVVDSLATRRKQSGHPQGGQA